METCVFSSVVTVEEWNSVPSEIGTKISKFVEEKFEEFITAKALLETKSFNAEQVEKELKDQSATLKFENDSLILKIDTAKASLSDLESQLSELTAEVTKLQNKCGELELETSQFRHERNLAVDERDQSLYVIQRRESEIERLQSELNLITEQFQAAVNAKCEAIAQNDEITSLKMTLDYKEKRLDQERTLLNSQVESLTEELKQRTEELLNMRRDNSSRCVQLEIKLTEKVQELQIANEQIHSLNDLNQNLSTRNEELSQKILNLRDTETKMNESYVCEIEANTKMANAYKAMFEDSQKHAEEFKEALKEVQDLLKSATEQYGELETKNKESELMHEEIMAKKNECIAMLKKELETANELIDENKQDSLLKDREGISHNMSASISARMNLNTSMSYTECYTRYVNVSEQLTNKELECARLNNYITTIVKEIDEKGPMIKRLREEYSDTLDANDNLKAINESLMTELQSLREGSMEVRRMEGQVVRENERLKKEVADLSRQVVHLLQEIEHSRAGSSSTSTDNDMSDSVNSADIITKRLVTFNDIVELQSTNQKLLALVRELTEKQEEIESMDLPAIANMKSKLEELRESHAELLRQREQQNKMMEILGNQCDRYRSMCRGQDVSDTKMESDNNATTQQSMVVDSTKLEELEAKIEKYKKKIEDLKEENETYRKDKSDNEKILLEQIETMRSEVKTLTKQNCQLAAQIELSQEKFKVLQNNTEIYKKQISGLEKQNKLYSESIIKHEQAAIYLKDEVIQNQTKLSTAEVQLSGLQKDFALMKDSENRLLKERELLKRDSFQQNLLQKNIELIKASIERRDAEDKLKLENKLDDAHRECAALRRRLQEEQNHFRQLSENLEAQTKRAQARADEEQAIADKLRAEIGELREQLNAKTVHINELSKKLKSSVFSVPENYGDERRIRELEQQLLDATSEIESLKINLKTSKTACDEYMKIAERVESKDKTFADEIKALNERLAQRDQAIRDLEEKCNELQGELSIQLDDQDITNASIKTRSQQLQDELNIRTMDLKTARTQLENARSEIRALNEQLKAVENKYAREVTLHSVDLQSLTDSKEELARTTNELKEAVAARDQAMKKVLEHEAQVEERLELLQKQKLEMEERFEEVTAQNALLLDQIEALNDKLTLIQAQVTTSIDPDISANRAYAELEANSSEQLLQVIKYLRKEKDIAVSKADVIEAEHVRLKSQFETIEKQLKEAKAQLEFERQKSEGNVVSTAKHAEVVRKLETLNAITDSNRALRIERDELLKELSDLRVRASELEDAVAPLQEKTREATGKVDQLQSENISLRAECTRWRQRANLLIEKTNRTSPEDWKKLQTERETLAKHLTIERANITKLNDEISTLKIDRNRMEEQLKQVRSQNSNQSDDITNLKMEITSLQSQFNQTNQSLEQQNQTVLKMTEENRVLTEDTAGKDVTITELKNNLAQVKKIAKKYKNQYEDQTKDLEALRQQSESDQTSKMEKQQQLLEEQRTEHEERLSQIETTHKEAIDQLNVQVSTSTEQIESLKREMESLKQSSSEKEEKFKTLFKNAKERIVSLTEQNNNLREELSKLNSNKSTTEESTSTSSGASTSAGVSKPANEELAKVIQKKQEIVDRIEQENDRLTTEVDRLTQRILQLERQFGLQQGVKPSTSSATSEKGANERPTADIKPMAGHSTNTQTQSVPIQPWRSGGEPPLASIRPMSQQLRTVAVLPTSQTPSAVMVPPQQQVHTTGSSSIESLSSSPTSSHTDYVPATSSAGSSSSTMLGPRQIAVPPTQSTDEDDGNNVTLQTTTSTPQQQQQQQLQQQQAVALVLPRVEPPCSNSGAAGSSTTTSTSSVSVNISGAEQGSSNSNSGGSSNTVTTTQAGLKRQREPDGDGCQGEEQRDGTKGQQQIKRTRMQQTGTVSDSGVEVEYQVPTSSQRDHDDDNVIVVESDEEGGADEGEGAVDDDQDDPDTEGYDMETMEQDNYGDADCPGGVGDDDDDDEDNDVDEAEGGNEVEVIEDSSEVPNQSREDIGHGGNNEQPQSEAISSGTDGTGRSVPTTPLQSSPQECIPGAGAGTSSSTTTVAGADKEADVEDEEDDEDDEVVEEDAEAEEGDQGTTASTSNDAEIPDVIITGEADDDNENHGEGSSECLMRPPEVPQLEHVEELESEDGVSSEGEKPPPVAEDGAGEVEEGREAEASPSPNTRSRNNPVRGSPAPRRSQPNRYTMSGGRSNVSRAGPPTPIVWSNQQQQHGMSPQRQQQQDRIRGGASPGFASRSAARRSRGRIQRPFGGRY